MHIVRNADILQDELARGREIPSLLCISGTSISAHV
jgi:hypothetical protein